ncbi:ribosome maturation factor RimM [Ammoniphilus oxalaticus]|uniref:Ribosome maturation factor RimM n=1 Tax=Ammoniphilus oxalaticus TaxID=66863 RepID=A0A419SJP3_9BACL|nr:ribosome maturation factor RimM [Ammoniphilus oxalaticus]RKD24180.1 ribosome maturation factor RimM [Ammoniphilus oxalaticus]
MERQMYDVGKIVNTHGIRGELRIFSVTDFPEERFQKGSELFLAHDSLQEPLPITIQSVRKQKNLYIVKLKEFDNINQVEKYKGGVFRVSEEDRIDLEEGEFYYDDIVGCEAWSDEGVNLGVISDILETGANDVWVVKREGQKDLLLPYIDDCILEVDVAEKRVKVHVMEGLME